MLPSYTRLAAAAALVFAGVARADSPLGIIASKEECGLVMFDIYGDFEWPGVGYGDYYGALCQNPNPVISIYAAMYTYCKEDEIEPGLYIIRKWCKDYGETELADPSEYAANLTKEAIAALPVYNQDDLEEDSNVTAPFLFSQSWFEVAMKSEHSWDLEYRLHAAYM